MKRQCVIVDNDCEHPPWVDDLAHKLTKCWKSAGGITMLVNKCEEDHWHLICCPSLREIVGGENDGGQVYARFQLNIGRVVRFFEKTPKVMFDAAADECHPFLVFIGKVNEEEVQLAIVSGPVPGQPVTELAYVQGLKKGIVEPRLPQPGEGDYDAGSE